MPHPDPLLYLQERRCYLDDQRVAALAHLNQILGAILELDYIIAQWEQPAPEPAKPAEQETQS